MDTTNGAGTTATRPVVWQVAGGDTRYCKYAFYGKPGSGKTFTASIVARQIAQMERRDQAYMIDSENGSDFVADLFTDAGMKLNVLKTREFSELVDALQAIQTSGDVVIVDSTTHFWKNVVDSFLKASGRKTIQLKDWAPITKFWDDQFTQVFVNSQLHVLLCGRLRYVYDSTVNDDGKLEFYRSDTKMGAGGDIAYEPNMLVHLAQIDNAASALKLAEAGSKEERAKLQEQIRHGQSIDFVLTVEKDRRRELQGRQIILSPTGELAKDAAAVEAVFQNNIAWLMANRSHHGVGESGSTTRRFEPEAQNVKTWTEEQRRRAIAMEELEGQMVAFIPGVTGKDKALKMGVLESLTGTRSWTKITEEIPLKTLELMVARIDGEPSSLERTCQQAVDRARAAKVEKETVA